MSTYTVDRIEEEIRGRFAKGIDLDPETIHFIESTYGEMFGKVPAGEPSGADNEDEVLVDLLFSPDEALCIRIERHLAPEGLCEDHLRILAHRLISQPIESRVRTEGARMPVSMPAGLVDGFLARLRLDRTLDAALVDELSDRYAQPDALRIRFRLRQARLFGTEAEKEALAGFFSARSLDREDFWPLLDTLAGFLESAGQSDLFSALAERKASCLRHLKQSADRNRVLERHNIETFLVGGARLPHVDPDALAAEILRIDELSRILFGQPAPAPAGAVPLDLGEIDGPGDLDRLMRFFIASENH